MGQDKERAAHDWKWNFLGSLYEPSHRRGPQGRPKKSFSNQLQYRNGSTPTSISQRMTTCMYYTTLDQASWRWLTVDCSSVDWWWWWCLAPEYFLHSSLFTMRLLTLLTVKYSLGYLLFISYSTICKYTCVNTRNHLGTQFERNYIKMSDEHGTSFQSLPKLWTDPFLKSSTSFTLILPKLSMHGLSCRLTYPQVPWTLLGTPGTMTPIWCPHKHEKRKKRLHL